MAKRPLKNTPDDGGTPGPGGSVTEARIEEFAEDLGRLLGSARAKADDWLGQRQAIAKQLTGIRDTAADLLDQLGHQAAGVARGVRKAMGVRAAPSAANEYAPAPMSKRKRRKLSAEARERIAAAQRARWAKVKQQKAASK